MTITIEKEWDGNVCESEHNNRIYVSNGRWQWLVIVDGEVDSAHDLKREATRRKDELELPVTKLPVIFRAHRTDGEVVAIFPTLPADVAGTQFTSYVHVGQHGGASLGWYYGRTHRPATEAEYAPLLRELRSIYGRSPKGSSERIYELVPVSKVTAAHLKVFSDEARRVRAQETR